MNNSTSRLFYFFSFLALLLLSEDVDAQKSSSGLLLKNGEDTISIERVTRRGDGLEGQLLIRKQIPIIYTATLLKDGRLDKFTMQLVQPGAPEGTPALQEAILQFDGKKIYSTSIKGESTERDTLASVTGALVYHPNLPMLGLLEQIVKAALEDKTRDSVPVFLLNTKGQTLYATVQFKEDIASLKLGTIQ